jgi:hypothetical protein
MPEPGLAEQLTGWSKKVQRFSDALPSLGMRTPEEEAARKRRLEQYKAEDAAAANPKPAPKGKNKP